MPEEKILTLVTILEFRSFLFYFLMLLMEGTGGERFFTRHIQGLHSIGKFYCLYHYILKITTPSYPSVAYLKWSDHEDCWLRVLVEAVNFFLYIRVIFPNMTLYDRFQRNSFFKITIKLYKITKLRNKLHL